MKAKNFTNRFFAVLTIVSLTFLASCSSDSASDNNVLGPSDNELAQLGETPFSIVLKALNAEGSDVTTKGEVEGATLFVFNDQNDFVKQIPVDKSTLLQRKSIEISCPGADYITVIAWGGINSNNATVSSLNTANIISDLQIQLKENNGVAVNPGDLFYGQTVVNRPTSTKAIAQQEVKLERKVSSISLSTKGLIKNFGSTEGNYEYKVRASKDAFDYQGNLTGEEVEYIFSASFDEKGALVANTNTVLPSSNLTVELYKDGELLFSVKNDKNGENLSAKAGEQMNYVFNYSNDITANVIVTPWNTVVQIVTVG